jgi:hypothetical protein
MRRILAVLGLAGLAACGGGGGGGNDVTLDAPATGSHTQQLRALNSTAERLADLRTSRRTCPPAARRPTRAISPASRSSDGGARSGDSRRDPDGRIRARDDRGQLHQCAIRRRRRLGVGHLHRWRDRPRRDRHLGSLAPCRARVRSMRSTARSAAPSSARTPGPSWAGSRRTCDATAPRPETSRPKSGQRINRDQRICFSPRRQMVNLPLTLVGRHSEPCISHPLAFGLRASLRSSASPCRVAAAGGGGSDDVGLHGPLAPQAEAMVDRLNRVAPFNTGWTGQPGQMPTTGTATFSGFRALLSRGRDGTDRAPFSRVVPG